MKKKKHSLQRFRPLTANIVLTSLAPLLVWMGLIFLLSSRERVALTDSYAVSFVIFKSAHLIEYGILYALWFRLFYKLQLKNPYTLAFICTVLYAASDEFHQTFVPTREGKVRDTVIDTVGATVSYFIISSTPFVHRRLTK